MKYIMTHQTYDSAVRAPSFNYQVPPRLHLVNCELTWNEHAIQKCDLFHVRVSSVSQKLFNLVFENAFINNTCIIGFSSITN
jgi:hypothetical protein